MSKIMVPIDFSENSIMALETALSVANELKSDLRMVYGGLWSLSDRQEAEGSKGGLSYGSLDEDGTKCSCKDTR